ncbi:MAG TPA: hypothetical protein VH278_12265 [Burkholderiaceae bacterium]|nr:hypothetical protein [Burkholderiaceae bacterium]
MRRLHTLTTLLSLTLIAAAPMCRAGHNLKPASAEVSVLEDKDRAKVDLEENKNALKQLELDKMGSQDDSNCGSVNIGNDNGNQTGTGRVASHDTTVIVTGDVFNTTSCGR